MTKTHRVTGPADPGRRRRSSSRRGRGPRRVAVGAAIALGLAACGGGSGSGDREAAERPTPIGVAAAVVDAHGPDDEFAAVLCALRCRLHGPARRRCARVGARSDGTVEGVEQDGPQHHLIVAPVAGLTSGSSEPVQHTPDEVRAAMDGELGTVATYALLGATLGLSPEDVLGSPDAVSPNPETTRRSEEMIAVLLTLMDVGYSFDQALTGWLFGETDLAIGVDRSGETSTGVSLGGYPVAPCLALRDANGQVVAPAELGPECAVRSPTCARALTAGTITFDDIGSLLDGDADGPTADEAAPAGGDGEEPSGDVRSFSGPIDLDQFGGGDGIVANTGRLEAGADLTGTIEFYGEGPVFCRGRRVGILGLQRHLVVGTAPGAVVATGSTTYAGAAEFYVAAQSHGRCPGAPGLRGAAPTSNVASIDAADPDRVVHHRRRGGRHRIDVRVRRRRSYRLTSSPVSTPTSTLSWGQARQGRCAPSPGLELGDVEVAAHRQPDGRRHG